MSEQTIREKTQEIRNETQKYANTRWRVAEVLDDINSTKANKDATELSEVQVQNWKTALNVPKYPASVDSLSEQGNTYTKEQINELLENSGKNLGNTDLETKSNRTFTQNHIYTHATRGFPYYITDLLNKSVDSTFNLMMVQDANGQNAVSNGKPVLENLMDSLPSVKDQYGNYNASFSSYLVYNPTTKQIAVSDRPQIISNYNVPENITIQHNLSNHAINLVYNGGEPNIPENIRQLMNRVKELERLPYTLFRPEHLIISTMPKHEYPESIRDSYTIPDDVWEMQKDGEFRVKKTLPIPDEFHQEDYYFNNKYYTLTNAQLNIPLPTDKDWVIRLQTMAVCHVFFNAMSFEPNIGLHRNSLEDDMICILHNTVTRFHLIGDRSSYGVPNWGNSEVYFIKTGDIITIYIRDMNSGGIDTAIMPYKDRYKYLTFKMSNLGNNVHVFPNWLRPGAKFTNLSYWIQP